MLLSKVTYSATITGTIPQEQPEVNGEVTNICQAKSPTNFGQNQSVLVVYLKKKLCADCLWTIIGPWQLSNQIKSLLLSHHHSTCALVSEILESVLQTVQKQFTYRQYILTQKTMCRMHIHIVSTHSVLLDILAVINTHYTQNVHILHYVHLYTQWYVKKKL